MTDIKNPKVSILVPIYNVEKYLARCIDSVLAQDFTDFELILVDDGSPDRCPQICDKYAEKDNRIKVVHKSNGGLVSARLAGFQQAEAEYLMFLDSDDYLLEGAVRCLYQEITSGGYDVVKGRDVQVSPKGVSYGMEETRFFCGVLHGEEYVKAYIMGDVSPYLWGGIYRRTLFSEEIFRNFLFVSRQEDWVTQLSIASKVKSVCYIDKVVQAYMINDTSIMQTCITSYEYVLKIGDALKTTTNSLSDEVKCLLACDRVKELNRCFFYPELKFNWNVYRRMHSFLSDKYNMGMVCSMTDSKFLRFERIPLAFWMYTVIYRFLFKRLKLKGIKRKILR